MSMKKKFLALALAGMVALPMTANATGNVVTGDEGDTLSGQTQITGNILSDNGQAAAGRIQVELPSAMSFTINQNGAFQTANNYEINNQSAVDIKVELADFIETNPNGDITIEDESFSQNSKNRTHVALSLTGEQTVDLHDKTGVIFERLSAGTRKAVTLRGKVGTSTTTTVQSGVNEDFTVKFKITKKA